MSEEKIEKKFTIGDRTYWLIALLTIPVLSYFVTKAFTVFAPARCYTLYAHNILTVFWIAIGIISLRMLIGLVLGQKRKKILFYLSLPIILALLCDIIVRIKLT
jgi:hypothetical protein